MRPTTICKAGLTQPKMILDSEAFGLATEAQPQTAGPTVSQFMPACPHPPNHHHQTWIPFKSAPSAILVR